ncbi:MAG: isopentenyl phosphate kinase [Natronomonas sp.]
MTTVLKLGGSVITDKTEPETVDHSSLRTAAVAIGTTDDLVVVHGGGSFGHHHAAAHGVTTTTGTHDTDAIRSIHDAMERLNAAVVESLADAGAGAVPIEPFSFATRTRDGELRCPIGAFETMLAEGFVPVSHGDVVGQRDAGATIISGDELVVALAEGLDADRVGVCSAVPGVLDSDGTVVDRIDRFEAVEEVLGGSDATDVTGGMTAKVRELLALEAPAYVFGLEELSVFVEGEEPGTRIG